MSTNAVAFFIGLFGSVHCIGMCGPLALSMPSFHNRWWLVVADKIQYNLGRVLTYAFLGLLIGIIGKQLWLAGLQQGVSVFSGLLMLLAGFSGILNLRMTGKRILSPLLTPVRRLLNYALRHQAGHWVIGMLNGFLPCGFVYLALAGAVNTDAPLKAATYMCWFGAGTFPLMLLVTVSAGFVGPLFRKRMNRAIPYLMVGLGFWFVLRGLNLDIPYLSPAKPTPGVAICH